MRRGRTNLYEELGRVEAEPSNRNRRAEISRVHGELNRGYAKGGKASPDPRMGSKVPKIKSEKEKREDPYVELGKAVTGGEKGKPHSTREGQKMAGARYLTRTWWGRGKKKPRRQAAATKKFTPIGPQHRTSKGIGGVIKKGISQLLKPKGVFKPKPKKVDDIDKPFKGYDKSYTRADEKKMDSMLKKLGDEIKASPIPHKTQQLIKKLQKAYPHKKAKGGRIGLKHGSAQSHYLQHGYGPTKTRLRTGKPKIAIKGWS